jgi:hypothetical protein
VETRICPLWTGNVPVRAWSSPAAPIVGWLAKGGDANWFVSEKWSNKQVLGRSYNHYWASTLADKTGRWGWVSEVYFRGGRNDEDDGGLLGIPPLTCSTASACKTPPWWRR